MYDTLPHFPNMNSGFPAHAGTFIHTQLAASVSSSWQMPVTARLCATSSGPRVTVDSAQQALRESSTHCQLTLPYVAGQVAHLQQCARRSPAACAEILGAPSAEVGATVPLGGRNQPTGHSATGAVILGYRTLQ